MCIRTNLDMLRATHREILGNSVYAREVEIAIKEIELWRGLAKDFKLVPKRKEEKWGE